MDHGINTPEAPDPAQNNAIAPAAPALGMADPISRLYENVEGLHFLAATTKETHAGIAILLECIAADIKKCACCLDDAGVLPPEVC